MRNSRIWLLLLPFELSSMLHCGIGGPSETPTDTLASVPVYTYDRAWRRNSMPDFNSQEVPMAPRNRMLVTDTCHAAPRRHIVLSGTTTCSNGQPATFQSFQRRTCRGAKKEVRLDGVERGNRDHSAFQSFKIICGHQIERPHTTTAYLLDLYDPPRLEFMRGLFGLAVKAYRKGFKTQVLKITTFCLVWMLYHAIIGYMDLHINEQFDSDLDIIAALTDCALQGFAWWLIFVVDRHANRRHAWIEWLNSELEFTSVGLGEHRRDQLGERWEGDV